jgi:uncharacterized protein YdeI (YjbR/CyaY-like superfamily)
MEPQVCPRNRAEWRAWLQDHHASTSEAWLVFYKKHTGKPSIAYRDSVEEAICFGWIDGLKRRIDDERYAHRFTPRKENSKWSPLNISLAEQMIAEGKMTPAGLEAFERRRAYNEPFLEARESDQVALPPSIEKALRSNRTAWTNYNALAAGYRKQYAGWLASAVKPETRQRRIEEAIQLLEQNKKLGMK